MKRVNKLHSTSQYFCSFMCNPKKEIGTMKKSLGLLIILGVIAMMSVSCRQHKQSCAAYDKVEIKK